MRALVFRPRCLIRAVCLFGFALGCSEPPSDVPAPTPAALQKAPRAKTPALPKISSPAAVARAIAGKTLFEGDAALAELHREALDSGLPPSFKASVDFPYEDRAAQAISEELRQWIKVKMAAFGFEEASAQPTVSWIVHIDPMDGGRYRFEAKLRSRGKVLFEKSFELPNAYRRDRLDELFSKDFVRGLP